MSGWIEFAIMAGTFIVVAVGTLVWAFFFRGPKRRRRKHRHHHQYRKTGVTLAQTGGLPPTRPEEAPPDPPASPYEP